MATNTTLTACLDNSTHTNLTAANSAVENAVSLWIYLALRILWAVLAIFGNGLTILAVTRFERLQTCTNYFICSLAVSDLLSAVSVPLIVVYTLYAESWFFIQVCLFQKVLSMMSKNGILHSILYLTIDRYIYIAYPLRYHVHVTPRRTCMVLTVTWLWSLVITPVIMYTATHLQLGMSCEHHIILYEWVEYIYVAPQFFILVLLSIGFHLAIVKTAYEQAKQIKAAKLPHKTLSVAINQSSYKISRTLALVLGVNLLSYMAPCITGIIVGHSNYSWIRYTSLIYWAITWVNPLIYAWRLKHFRIAFRKIFTGIGHFNECVPRV